MTEAESLHRSGTYRVCSAVGESYKAFIPHPLPPDPPLQLSGDDADLIERANRALGRLDGVTTMLPDTNLFLYLYVRKEALLSSQIEGTQSSFTDLLLYEHEEAPAFMPTLTGGRSFLIQIGYASKYFMLQSKDVIGKSQASRRPCCSMSALLSERM